MITITVNDQDTINEVIIRDPKGIMLSISQSPSDRENIGIEMAHYGTQVFSGIYKCTETITATITKLKNIIRMDTLEDDNKIQITKERIPDARGNRHVNRLLVVQDMQTVVRC